MKEIKQVIFAGCFGVGFGLGLGCLLGYQLHEQTTPAAEVAQQTAANTNKIAEIVAWRDKYAKPKVIKPTKECRQVRSAIPCDIRH